MNSPEAADRVALGRLAWRCRRGMKELDLVLQQWLQRHLPHASVAERAAFEALLEWTDPQLVSCLLAQAPLPPETALAAVVAQLRADCAARRCA